MIKENETSGKMNQFRKKVQKRGNGVTRQKRGNISQTNETVNMGRVREKERAKERRGKR
jgi:hypothetical protein